MDKHIKFEELESGEEITNEVLARMVAKGFTHADKRFDFMEEQLMDDHRKRIEELESDMRKMKKALAL